MADRELQYVGLSLPIHDAAAKATGRMRYTGDLELQDMLHAKLLFSPLPHARIKSVNADRALALPGVVGVYCHLNTPATPYSSVNWFTGQQVIEDERLFPDTARFVGDRVAAVLAVDEQTAAQALGRIEVEYEPLPAVYDPEAALQPGAPSLHPYGAPFFTRQLACGDAAAALERADLVVADRVETPKIHHAALENHVCLAYPDHNGKITVLTPCQILYSVRLVVAKVLGLPCNKVRVIKMPLGGSFGGKQEVVLETICAYLAQAADRPVKIELDRQGSITSTRTRTRTVGYVRTGLDREGRILGREVKVICDAGAYTSNGFAVASTMGRKLFRVYRIPDQSYQGMSVHTNTPVAGAARGYGSPQIMAITEINLDHAARELGMDPVELRLKNLMQPYDPDPTGFVNIGNARLADCLLAGARAFGWAERYRRSPGSGRFRQGIGMACGTHFNGHFGTYQDFTTMTLRMLEDGSLLLLSGIHDLGCGTVTTMKQIVAEVLRVHPDRIEAPEGDTESSPYDTGSQASRVTHVCGAAALRVAEIVRDMLKTAAAGIYGCQPAEVAQADGHIWPTGRPELKAGYGEMASRIMREQQVELIATHTYRACDNPGSYAAHFAGVEVDTLTGLVRVTDVVAAHDVGRAINPGFVEGQIHGGVQMGIGLALREDLPIESRTGRVTVSSFRQYHLVNAPDMPPVKVLLIEAGGDRGPFGAKGVGEIATVPTAPAVVNAVNCALGSNLTSLPLTPAKVLAALASTPC